MSELLKAALLAEIREFWTGPLDAPVWPLMRPCQPDVAALLGHIDALTAQTCIVCGQPAEDHWNSLAANPCLWGGPRLTQRDVDGWNRENEYVNERCRERDALTGLARELAEALDRMTDDEPCRLDHHGYCQEHSLTAPCHTAVALGLLAKAREAGLLP